MRLDRQAGLVLSLIAVLLGAAWVATADPRQGRGWTPIPKEDQAVFDAMVRASTPGRPHKLLASLAGDWNFSSRLWMNPDLPPEESVGTATNSMMMGGRYLKSTFSGALAGIAFEGFGITGFDNTSGRCQSVWLDNASTVLLFMTGTYDAATKTFTLRAEMNDLVDPAVMIPVRQVLTLVDGDVYRMEMFESRSGRESRTLELTFRRKK